MKLMHAVLAFVVAAAVPISASAVTINLNGGDVDLIAAPSVDIDVGATTTEYDFTLGSADDFFYGAGEDTTPIDLSSNDFFIIDFDAQPVSGHLLVELENPITRLFRNTLTAQLLNPNAATDGSYNIYLSDDLTFVAGDIILSADDESAPSITTFDVAGNSSVYLLYAWTIDEGNSQTGSSGISPSEVPLPASALLMLGALGGLAAVRRKRT